MPKQPTSIKTFKPIFNSYAIVYLIIFSVLGIAPSIINIPPFLVIVGVLIIFVLVHLLSYHQVTITDDALIHQMVGAGKVTVLFKDVYEVQEQFGITLITSQRRISLTRHVHDYALLYRLLREKITPSAFDDHLNLPWKLRMHTRQGFRKVIREILLTDEHIIVRQNDQETIWSLDQIERIYLKGGAAYREPRNEFDVMIKTSSGVYIKITQQQAQRLGFTPEHLAANLHRLYPQIAPVVENIPPSVDMLIQRGEMLFAGGNLEKAISLFEQATATDRYQWQTWQQLGLCHLQAGNYQKAATAFREAVTLNNEDATSFYNGAIAFSQIGNRIMARVYLKEALALAPELKANVADNLYLKGVLE